MGRVYQVVGMWGTASQEICQRSHDASANVAVLRVLHMLNLAVQYSSAKPAEPLFIAMLGALNSDHLWMAYLPTWVV